MFVTLVFTAQYGKNVHNRQRCLQLTVGRRAHVFMAIILTKVKRAHVFVASILTEVKRAHIFVASNKGLINEQSKV